jgi:hypothetical protein
MKKFIQYTVVVLVLLSIFSPEVAAQCSQCKLLAEQSGSGVDAELLGDGGGNNINTAIIYIMFVPYLILSILFRKQIKRFFKSTFSK